MMQTYSALRVSAVVIPAAWVLLALTGFPQTREQDWDLDWEVWALLVLATLGPLVLTNILWFRSLHRVGPARATLAVNLQPFVAALLAVVLLSEPLSAPPDRRRRAHRAGLVVARRRAPAPQGA